MSVNVLIIDDDKFSQKLISKVLHGHFDTCTANNGTEGIAKARELQPDIIILDVEMPDLTGYEVCDQLKLDDSTRLIPVVFLSGHSSLRERMQGYESGGDDYLTKPFEPETLIAKLLVLTKYGLEQRELQAQFQEAQKTAHIAMTGSSELGLAMQFVENSYQKNDYEHLAESFFEMTDRLGLNCTLMFVGHDTPLLFSSSGTVSPLESELLSMMREDKRIYDFGCRTIINYPQVSLLIKNMPINDMERYGRIKDLLPIVLGTVNAKIIALNTEQALHKQTNDLTQTLNSIRQCFEQLSSSHRDNQNKSVEVMRSMLDELSQRLPLMGLEDDQEAYILNRVDKAIEESFDIIDNAKDISLTFDTVISELNNLVTQQNALIDTYQEKYRDTGSQPSAQDEDSYTMDVELF